MTDFWAVVFNPSTFPRFFHTVVSTWVVGGFLVAGVAAWYLLKGRHVSFAKSVMPVALTIALLASLAMPLLGHWSADQVARTQPTKLAAFEGQYQTMTNAPLMLFGWTDQTTQKTTAIGIPSMLSLLVGFNPNTEIKGLAAFPQDLWPPVNLTFQTYHIMVDIGIIIVAIAALAVSLNWRGRLATNRFALWLLVAAPFLAEIAIQTGWAAAEVGRQPWIVWGEMKTVDAISVVVPAYQIALTLAIFFVIYLVLLIAWVRIFFGVIARGPAVLEGVGVREPVSSPAGTGSATVAAASDPERR
jgi:cytochrome d ubiquinol oxidase subunit I